MLDKMCSKIRFFQCREDIIITTAFFTRIPINFTTKHNRVLMQACWCFPVIGAAIGLPGSAFLYLLLAIHIPVPISAIITIGFFIILTGALHEDGLADTADGLGGGVDKSSKIEKMKYHFYQDHKLEFFY